MQFAVTNFGSRLAGCWLLLATLLPARAADDPPDFSSLSLQELAAIKVTSVSKTEQRLSQVAAAVYVISQEEIHRSGMTNVADVLRLAPGLSVARLDGSKWAVTARGFNGRFANKLLVLIDGRSVYTPTFSGVYWDMSFPLLDDIERIEVIRGPGASVWGANAVNGVINIITKDAGAINGVSVSAGGGTSERAFGQVRFGGKVSDGISYRGYFSGADRSALQTPGGGNAQDGWSDEQGGFRIDGTNRNGGWQLEGDIYRNQRSDLFTVNAGTAESSTAENFAGTSADMAFEWRRRISENSDIRITTYYDFVSRPEPEIPTVQTRTGDFEVQYHLTRGRHDVSVGLADRLISEDFVGTGDMVFNPPSTTYQLAGGFAQDEVHYLNDRLLVTVGAKIEHSIFGGWQLEPSVRTLWAPNKRHSAWVAVSRAARTPAFYERDATVDAIPPTMGPTGLPVVATVNGTPQFQSEILDGYEAGYRAQLSPRFSIDIAAFYDNYQGLNGETAATPTIAGGAQPYLLVPFVFSNNFNATGVGGEFTATYQPFSRWKLAGSYSYLNLHQRLRDGAPADTLAVMLNSTSNNQWKLQSYLNLSKAVQLDCLLFSSSSFLGPGDAVALVVPDILVPPHTRLDLRLSWRVTPRFEVSLDGQDLLSPRHLELTPEVLSPPTDAVRGYYLKTTWRF